MSAAGAAFSAIDHAHMARALRLAERGLYTTQPNPRVGCVIAHGAEIVGEGWHERAGEAHAEVFALRDAGARAREATAYVTLEPCGLHGRTPPCADALIAAGVARVVIAAEDAFQREGGAIERMRAAGIIVESGLMREASRELNRGFFSRVERGRPWVRIKLAMSLDGRTALANGESKWITGEAAREDVQRWRARSSAILTGSGTVLADDPRLTLRLNSAHAAPLRVVLDRGLRTPRSAHVLDGSVPTLIFHAAGAKSAHDDFGQVELAAIDIHDGRLDLLQVLQELGRRGVNELQVEAGPTLCGALLQSGFVDELLLYTAPVVLGDKARPLLGAPDLAQMAQAKRLHAVDRREIGGDTRILYRE
ncbi:bifunctional diaminohydroxyphosphoribosylaminopyrimidine deaminase/5-amino-6-(5-phosphoribosylamino)uracil reductase RibD [Rudaea sp.]|uniref:bifunctional diaminohydroxyphosphoribosylaminopyrimidine deaminase/5-amino-6-(5-phosphoribosylamino)uracil reductase RibD n=1 Tax=Rudaea sp. TaxID=2136325 RepID=UPI002ED08278